MKFGKTTETGERRKQAHLLAGSICLAATVAFGAFGADGVKEAAPLAKPAEAVDYGLRNTAWRIAPDGEELLAKWRQAPYRRISDHTALFVRAQLKYGINRNDFLHHWYDRPLLQDSSLGQREDTETETKNWLNVEGWKKTIEMVRLGKQDGLAVFTCTKGREEAIPLSVMPGHETTILVELTTHLTMDECIMRAEQALAMPNSFRIGGKVVITSYPMIKERRLPFYAELRRRLIEKHGDRFLVMPYSGLLEEFRGTSFGAKELTAARERLARFLRSLDGLCYNARESYFNRRYDPWLFDTVLVPLIHATLADPEFAGKKHLGCWATPGHENSYRWNKGLDSTGTRMLRDTLESITKLKPDFIIGCEWDEENENTHFRPTVANGFTHQRIMRYYVDRMVNRAPSLFPGDAADVPNLVLSYRKDLMAGEPLETEVLNIPDGTFGGKTFTVRLRWLDAAGQELKAFEPRTLAADELKAAWFTVPVSEFVGKSQIAVPELTVWADGWKAVHSEGLWPVGLHASRTLEQKWVKQPLRDLPKGVKGALSVVGPDAEGLYTVSGKMESPELLRSVEVRDGADTVYMAGGCDHQPGVETVRIAFQGFTFNGNQGRIRGRISLEAGGDAKLTIGKSRGNVTVENGAFVFTGAMCNNWPHYLYADVPAEAATAAKFVFDLEPFGKGEVELADLATKDVVAFPAADGAALVFTRYRSCRCIPNPILRHGDSFSFRVRPDTPRSVFRMEAIDSRYHVFRSAAVTVAKDSGHGVRYHVYERDLDRVSEVTVDAARVPVVQYEFNPSRGGVLATGADRGLWGICGSYAPLVTGYGQGESGYGMLVGTFMRAGAPESVHSSPEWVKEGDAFALAFRRGGFVSFGQQLVPTHAGFELAMEVKPVDVKRRQGLLSSGPTAFNLYIENGKACASFFLRNRFMRLNGRAAKVSIPGPDLKPGAWNRIKVVFDQTRCHLEVDGEAGAAVETSGDLLYPQPMALGAGTSVKEFFEGEIRSLSVQLR